MGDERAGGGDLGSVVAQRRKRLATRSMRSSLRALRNPQYRLWAVGALVSNVGTWMQRTAQDWLVLTELTRHSASAVGWVMALQFAPQILFLPWTGYAADHVDRRRLVMATQAALGISSLALGAMAIAGVARLWHVYVFAFGSGTVAAFDTPARQTFVADLVGDDDLANAVALNSTSFNTARMIGPAVAGVCIAAWGTGWAILVNGLSFLGVLTSLWFIRPSKPQWLPTTRIGLRDALLDGVLYVAKRDDLRTIMAMLVLFGAFGLNFPIFISTMSVTVFGMGAGRFGLLTSILAVGTTLGALLAAGRETPRMSTMTAAAALFGVGLAVAAAMPNFWLFGAVLLPVGIASLTVTNVSNSLTQLAATPAMRGRVVAIRMSVMSGFSFVGAPVIGQVADRCGPRAALGVGALAGIAAAAMGWRYLLREQRRQADAAGDPRVG